MKYLYLSLGAFAALISCVCGACPTNYIEIETLVGQPPSCFRFIAEKATWDKQVATCKGDGANLVTKLDGNGLLFILREYILDRNGMNKDGYFVDGTDEGHENDWRWTVGPESAMSMGAPYWWPGQPDNNDGNANVACMFTPDFFMHDCRAEAKIRAICQI